MTNSRTSRGPV